MKRCLSLIFLLTTLSLFGQETKFSKKNLSVDLDSLISFIEQVHPNPYTCISKKQFYKEIGKCKEKLKDSASLIGYFTIISPIIAQLNDGHTGILFPYQEWQRLNPYTFPFNCKIVGERKMLAPENLTEIPPNAEIISINRIPSKQIIKKLISSISGESKNFRMAVLNNSFAERFGAFYGFKPSYKVVYKTEGEKNTITIPGFKLNELLELTKKKRQNNQTNNNQLFDYRTLKNAEIGIIDFKAFSDLQLFTHFLDSVFTKIKQEKTEILIIDLRNNGGGNSDLGDELFQYISKVPFSQYGKTTTKYSRKRVEFYTEYRNMFLNDLSDSTFNELILPGYGTISTENDSLKPLRENKLRFDGNVYLLTSSNTFSSASDFAWCFQYFRTGKIVGEETGGYIVCFGDIIYVSLPTSKLQMSISHKEFYGYGATDKERHGVVPDYKIDADKAFDFTIDLINHNSRSADWSNRE